jgi:hypothetical protein
MPALENKAMRKRRMGNWWIAVLLGIGWMGCAENAGNAAPSDNLSTVIAADSVTLDSPVLEDASQRDSLELLAFDTTQMPKVLQWQGDLMDGGHWRDRNGEHWLLISQVFEGELSDKSLSAALFATCYVLRKGVWESYWAIKEYNQDYFSAPQYVHQSLKISDLDKDGLAESFFIYQIEPDGSAPTAVKMMLHVKGQKYALRGQLAGMDYDRGKVEERHFDPAFKMIDPLFRDYALESWERYQRKYYQGWPAVED